MNYYQTFMECLEEGFCIIEVLFNEKSKPVDYRFLEVNPAFEKQTGLHNVIGKRMRELKPQHEEFWFQIYGEIALSGKPVRFQNAAKEIGRYYSVSACRVGKPEERKVAVLFWDISVQSEMENELIRREKNYQSTLDNLLEGCAILNYEWQYLYVNPKYAEHIKLKPEEITGRKVLEVFPGIGESTFYQAIKKCMEKRVYQNVEDNFTFADGTTRWMLLFAHPVPEGVFILVVDVTRRKTAEINLKNALNEKELLLKELYHRTKNNMQVISSLLNIRSSKIKDEVHRNEFLEMRNRIWAMSLVHEKLYQSQSLTYLNLGSYIRDLVNLLRMSQADRGDEIEIEFNITDYQTSIDTAITIGLVITELIINIFKYAFPEHRSGKINISLISEDGKARLIIADNGIGMPPSKGEESIGISLVKDLVEDQLNGSINLQSSGGTSWTIIF